MVAVFARGGQGGGSGVLIDADREGGGGRFLVMTAGACSLFLVLLMGTIRETARGPYTVYGLQTQSQGQQPFSPSRGFYP